MILRRPPPLALPLAKILSVLESDPDRRFFSLYLLAMYSLLGALAAFLLFYPATLRSDVSFLLSKETIDLTEEATRISEAVYRGQDAQGRRFALSVDSAVQQSTDIPIVNMTNMKGAIELDSGQASIFAAQGQYDIANEKFFVDGSLRFAAPDGYRLTVSNVSIDLQSRAVQSHGAVEGNTNIGQFSANRLFVDLDNRVLRLDGGVRVVMNRGALQ